MLLDKTDKRQVLFWMKVDKSPGFGPNGDCWRWTGASNQKEYGIITVHINGKQRFLYAHRVSYEWEHGDIPEGKIVRHSCDNPKCVRPSHLIVGTHQDNSDDKMERGRYISGVAEIIPEEVLDIRFKRSRGESAKNIGLEYGLSPQHISNICTGVYWPDVGGPLTRRFEMSDPLIYSVLSDTLVMSQKMVAEKNKISLGAVQTITQGKRVPRSIDGISILIREGTDMTDDQIELLQGIADNPRTLHDVREAVLQAIKDSKELRSKSSRGNRRTDTTHDCQHE